MIPRLPILTGASLLLLPLLPMASSATAASSSTTTTTLLHRPPQPIVEVPTQGISFRGNRPKEHYSFQVPQDHEFRSFQSNSELREAVKQYKSYKDFDETLATKYGWPLGSWDVSHVSDFGYIFQHKRYFNEPLTNWDTSQATNMEGMFQDCQHFNQDLSHFNTSHVQDMSNMFEAAIRFEGKGVEKWNMGSVIRMDFMFLHALAFANGDICHNWQVHNVQSMKGFLKDARSFSQDMHLDLLAEWHFHPHVDMLQMSDFWISGKTTSSSPGLAEEEHPQQPPSKGHEANPAATPTATQGIRAATTTKTPSRRLRRA